MTRKSIGVSHFRNRRAKRSTNKYGASTRNTAKSQRDRISIRPAPALVDPIRMLGHPPRGRRHW